jgi:hypothetical protein
MTWRRAEMVSGRRPAEKASAPATYGVGSGNRRSSSSRTS